MAASGTTKKISVNNILGASGTATLASATITGDLTVDTSTLKVDSTNNRVGIGTATPLVPLHAETTGTGTTAFSNFVSTFRSQAAGRDATLQFSDGTNQAAISMLSGALSFGTAGSNTRYNIDSTGISTWSVGGTTAMTLNSTGLAVANGNVILSTSGKGIDFSATANSSGTMTSELLNDYEEGTFTPTVIGATTAGVGTYAVQVGRYTKIGNLVTVQVYLGWGAHTGTGNMRFGNFPFTTSSDSGSNNGVSFGYVHNIALSASNVLTGFTSPGSTYIDAYQYPVGGGASAAVPIDTAGDVIFTASYRV
jgi:hypothetical protein